MKRKNKSEWLRDQTCRNTQSEYIYISSVVVDYIIFSMILIAHWPLGWSVRSLKGPVPLKEDLFILSRLSVYLIYPIFQPIDHDFIDLGN